MKEETPKKLVGIKEDIERFVNSDKDNAMFAIACAGDDNDDDTLCAFTYSCGGAWNFSKGFYEVFKAGFDDNASKTAENLATSIVFGVETLLREHSTAANNLARTLLSVIMDSYGDTNDKKPS